MSATSHGGKEDQPLGECKFAYRYEYGMCSMAATDPYLEAWYSCGEWGKVPAPAGLKY
jgi:hypothetical protein